ncbi:amino acid ABC transporter permease [Spongiactinospora gelatinilytica]|uniref:amino acid ABC transporter permease n=1 Tax=Spongiactinospora gelatinilytica TaxID=2666298 RepID=UPI0011B94B72|nr:amino acid ABC transporter permease [Spongiactinospora gelatinilytica]
MSFDWSFLWTHMFDLSPHYGVGLQRTLFMAVISMIFGVMLGMLVALARLSKIRVISGLAALYVWLLRGVPELVILILLYTGLAAAGIFRFNDITVFGMVLPAAMQAAIFGFSIREGAYMGEIFRGGIMAVDRGQVEAAKALGMKRIATLRRIILPQAMRVVVPPMGNQFTIMLKATSLASVLGVPELLLTTQTFAAETFRVFELFIGLAVNYLILTTVWTFIQSLIEARLARHEADTTTEGPLARARRHLFGAATPAGRRAA